MEALNQTLEILFLLPCNFCSAKARRNDKIFIALLCN